MGCNKHGGIVFREIWVSANFLKCRIIANYFIADFFKISFCLRVSFLNKKRKEKKNRSKLAMEKGLCPGKLLISFDF